MTNKEMSNLIINFSSDPQNIMNCSECPYNINAKGNTLPCGQYHCWVEITCNHCTDRFQEED